MLRLLPGLLCAAAVLAWAPDAGATPIYALRAANACDTCHIEPSGWANPPDADRLCTLDCRGCHVSPTGGGLRTPSGLYYGREVLPTWGTRPSQFADPEKYRPEGHPKKGRARLFEDFTGWWPGSIDMQDIKDRFGDIDPDPKVRFGFDIRAMVYLPTKGEADPAVFPMQSDFHLAYRPLEQFVTYLSGGLAGRRAEDNYIDSDRKDEREVLDYFTVREAFVMMDRMPNNMYVRAGRFAPPFGWRIPDHTSFIRRDLQFDQYRSVFGVEGGWNPNYPYANVAAFYQGAEFWPGDQNDKGLGAAATFGLRELNYQYGGSLHYLSRTDDGAADDLTAGVNWGVTLYPLVYLGELDFKRSIADGDAPSASGLVAYHELNWLMFRGLSSMLKYDWSDLNLDTKDDHSHRVTAGVTWHPYTHLQIDAQYRKNWVGTNPVLDLGDSTADETLLMFRGWF